MASLRKLSKVFQSSPKMNVRNRRQFVLQIQLVSGILIGRKNETREKAERNTASMDNKPRRLAIFFIAFTSFPGLAFGQQPPSPSAAPAPKLVPPAHGKIPIAFIIGRGAETIDFVGPWVAFQSALRPLSTGMSMDDVELFQLYTVADSKAPVRVSGGMRI